ncbi:fibrinogen C domain-containing protein 1-B-like [Syngnathus typhle]|uniref:fibrinogen C domain-containing protein 1-B-like n=1 Tax=Syngnathus typhle TaxID=161592 RepID=UPI002A6A2024|nr:fibrinogen C domain-containing protein 1-B-like [Syngnathus typhle]XP_061128152.1 fibrinogen C domain-containing protein 1-B-like [Syngnathus typhle]XP_061129105.1 fibrinogen C domain-containing protein 1-B-like [Syngnathus typhle]
MSNDKWFEMNQSTQKLIGEPPKRKFVQIRWSSILAVPTLLLVVLFIQNIVFFYLNRPQDIVKELGALVATLPNSIPDRNCTDFACHWAALQTALAQPNASHVALSNYLETSQTRLKAGQEAGQTALAELKAGHGTISSDLEKTQTALAELKAGQTALEAGQEAGQTALAELKAGHGAISSDLEKTQTALAELKAGQTALEAGQEAGQTALAELKAGQEAGQTALAELKASHNAGQSLLAKAWQEISSDKGLLSQTLKDLKTDYNSMSRARSQENKDLSSALSSLRQKVVDQPTLNRELHGLMPRDCSDIMAAGKSKSDVYYIFTGSNSIEVYCNMWQDGGGWTVIQRRKDGTVDFARGWNDFRKGFGRLSGEHWLGLQNIHALTASGDYQLRIDFTAFDGAKYYALYNTFTVGRNSMDPDKDGYPLYVSGYSGNAGDRFTQHSGEMFTTKDRDQDKWDNGNCATRWDGAWWHEYCHWTNLNGLYKATGTCNGHNVIWKDLGSARFTCLRFVEMKIRPRK